MSKTEMVLTAVRNDMLPDGSFSIWDIADYCRDNYGEALTPEQVQRAIPRLRKQGNDIRPTGRNGWYHLFATAVEARG